MLENINTCPGVWIQGWWSPWSVQLNEKLIPSHQCYHTVGISDLRVSRERFDDQHENGSPITSQWIFTLWCPQNICWSNLFVSEKNTIILDSEALLYKTVSTSTKTVLLRVESSKLCTISLKVIGRRLTFYSTDGAVFSLKSVMYTNCYHTFITKYQMKTVRWLF